MRTIQPQCRAGPEQGRRDAIARQLREAMRLADVFLVPAILIDSLDVQVAVRIAGLEALHATGDRDRFLDVEMRFKTVVCTGDRRLDLAYRLQVQGVEVRVEPTVQHAVAGLQEPLEVIASYTAYQDLAAAQMGIRQVSGGRP